MRKFLVLFLRLMCVAITAFGIGAAIFISNNFLVPKFVIVLLTFFWVCLWSLLAIVLPELLEKWTFATPPLKNGGSSIEPLFYYPIDPSNSKLIKLFISTAYSTGSSFDIGYANPLTIIAFASSSDKPLLIK